MNKDKTLESYLNAIYEEYNDKKFIHPDPLEFLFKYKNTKDREIVALVASSLAYGRVNQILKSVSFVLEKLNLPAKYLKTHSEKEIKNTFIDFKHRFSTDKDIGDLLLAIKNTIETYGSLQKCFYKCYSENDINITPALTKFVDELTKHSGANKLQLLPSPKDGSACKRLNLFLRWMLRHDNIDPGGWTHIPTSKLLIPLDTHMYKIAKELRFTKRKSADLKTVIEITKGFSRFAPDDPVKFDFALTRAGIWKNNQKALIKKTTF